MGNDRLNHWWRARTAARLEDVSREGRRLELTAECGWDDGFVLVVPIRDGSPAARVDDATAEVDVRYEHGGRWARIVVPGGRHRVIVDGAGAA